MTTIPRPGSNPWYVIAPEQPVAAVLERLRRAGLATRHLRGERMRTTDGVFGEFAAALQFPPYFGFNWHAFDECLGDLSWLGVDAGVGVVISAGDELFTDAMSALRDFVTSVGYAVTEWAETSESGVGSDRPPASLLVVLQLSDAARTRWIAAGADLQEMTVDTIMEPDREND